jgi:hypothetical protein
MNFVWKNHTGRPYNICINTFSPQRGDVFKVTGYQDVEITLPENVTHVITHHFAPKGTHGCGKMVLLLERRVQENNRTKVTRVLMDGTEEKL